MTQFSATDKVTFSKKSECEQKGFLADVLTKLLDDRSVEIWVAPRIGSDVRSYVLENSNEILGSNFLFKGLLITIGLAVGAATLPMLFGLKWWSSLAAAILTCLLAGPYIARKRTQDAIALLSIAHLMHFDFFWNAKVVSLHMTATQKSYDPRIVKRWEDIVLMHMGWTDLQKGPTLTSASVAWTVGCAPRTISPSLVEYLFRWL